MKSMNVCLDGVKSRPLGASLLGFEDNIDDYRTWDSLLNLTIRAINNTVIPELQHPLERMSLDYYRDLRKDLEDYMLADEDPLIQICLSRGAHHGLGDNCVIKFLFRTEYQSSWLPLLARFAYLSSYPSPFVQEHACACAANTGDIP